jgi:hypothetical protein
MPRVTLIKPYTWHGRVLKPGRVLTVTLDQMIALQDSGHIAGGKKPGPVRPITLPPKTEEE